MNLIEAIKSGRPFRRKISGQKWLEIAKDGDYIKAASTRGEKIADFTPSDVLADDYEVQEAIVTITTYQFWHAAGEAFNFERVKCPVTSVLYRGGGGRIPPLVELELLARKLGLEPPK